MASHEGNRCQTFSINSDGSEQLDEMLDSELEWPGLAKDDNGARSSNQADPSIATITSLGEPFAVRVRRCDDDQSRNSSDHKHEGDAAQAKAPDPRPLLSGHDRCQESSG